MTSRLACAALIGVAAMIAVRPVLRAQSLTYTRGQNVAPAFEGWEQDPDGTKYFVFGYMNRNWVEELNIPPGPDNMITPGAPDQGQPTRFLPRRNRFVFRVPVPKTFTDRDEVVWSITAHGVTEKAWASLRADYVLDDVVKASETGALGAGTSSPEVRGNIPPTVKVTGAKTMTAKVGQPVAIAAVVTDDGIPKPRAGSPLLAFFGGSAGGRGAGDGTPAGPGGAPGGAAAGAATGSASAAAPATAAGAAGNPLAALFGGGGGRGGTPDIAAIAAQAGLSPAQVQQLIAARRNPELQPPARITVGKVTGLHLSWFVYRGAGKVSFTPEQVKTWEDTRAGQNSPWAPLWVPPPMPADGKVVVEATFSTPGVYVLKGLADDGALFGADTVTVTVTP